MNTEFAADFPILEQPGIYLNHAAMGPWARPTADAVTAFAHENMRNGARDYARWMSHEQQLHLQLAQFLGAASADDIALCKNTTEGLSLIAQGLSWQEGDEIIVAAQEFPSNRLPWLALESRGVRVRSVDLPRADPEAALINACNPHTRLLSVSAVQYGDGLRMHLARLGRHCRQHGILYCVDAIQQLGALPLDVVEIGCDFLAADAHKWLLGPEGIAVFYSRADSREQLQLRQHGWRMYTDPFNFERRSWQPPTSSRRFEAGSPNMMGIFALSAALGVFERHPMPRIADRILALRHTLAQGLAQIPEVEILSDERSERQSGIISFRPRHAGSIDQLQRQLSQAGIFGARRGSAIRWSPHFYQPQQQMEQAVEILQREIRTLTV